MIYPPKIQHRWQNPISFLVKYHNYDTLPKTNSKRHLKMDGWNTSLSYWGFGLFSGATLVSRTVDVPSSQPVPKRRVQPLSEESSSQKSRNSRFFLLEKTRPFLFMKKKVSQILKQWGDTTHLHIYLQENRKREQETSKILQLVQLFLSSLSSCLRFPTLSAFQPSDRMLEGSVPTWHRTQPSRTPAV